jgi:alkanesulfonate monooxygenase SsuD/methylene tetrahydromethanopterin reductase-like flavin-dependent oxidoreductase (luciferase family)
MHVGMAVVFQNPEDERSDLEVYQADLGLAALAEPLGFDSIWGVEHHFTDYTMCPDVLQFLSWCAGRTERVQLGSMVVVLPWHDPLRVAEQVSMLDNLSNGRVILGFGRGLGRVEFGGFRVDMADSRDIFVESAQMISAGLERGWCEFDGHHVKQPRRDLRPRPFKTFRGRTFAAAVSPESSRLMAELGLGILIIPQKPWEAVASELATYRSIYREVQGAEPPAPIASGWVFCDEDAGRAEKLARQYIGGYWRTVMKHYELKADHLGRTPGYESYGRMQEIVRSEGGAEAMIEFFLGLQVWGTPAQCYDRILDIQKRIGSQAFNAVFSYAGMPAAEAERNMRLFAARVMPELKKLEV